MIIEGERYGPAFFAKRQWEYLKAEYDGIEPRSVFAGNGLNSISSYIAIKKVPKMASFLDSHLFEWELVREKIDDDPETLRQLKEGLANSRMGLVRFCSKYYDSSDYSELLKSLMFGYDSGGGWVGGLSLTESLAVISSFLASVSRDEIPMDRGNGAVPASERIFKALGAIESAIQDYLSIVEEMRSNGLALYERRRGEKGPGQQAIEISLLDRSVIDSIDAISQLRRDTYPDGMLQMTNGYGEIAESRLSLSICYTVNLPALILFKDAGIRTPSTREADARGALEGVYQRDSDPQQSLKTTVDGLSTENRVSIDEWTGIPFLDFTKTSGSLDACLTVENWTSIDDVIEFHMDFLKKQSLDVYQLNEKCDLWLGKEIERESNRTWLKRNARIQAQDINYLENLKFDWNNSYLTVPWWEDVAIPCDEPEYHLLQTFGPIKDDSSIFDSVRRKHTRGRPTSKSKDGRVNLGKISRCLKQMEEEGLILLKGRRYATTEKGFEVWRKLDPGLSYWKPLIVIKENAEK